MNLHLLNLDDRNIRSRKHIYSKRKKKVVIASPMAGGSWQDRTVRFRFLIVAEDSQTVAIKEIFPAGRNIRVKASTDKRYIEATTLAYLILLQDARIEF